MDVLLWSLVVLLIVAGIAGTLLPMLPGTALVFAGLLLGAWIDDFTLVSGVHRRGAGRADPDQLGRRLSCPACSARRRWARRLRR